MNCILFACYLPSLKKRYVLEEIFDCIKLREPKAKVFIGIQYNSIPETEDVLRKIKGKLDISCERVSESMLVDSDASSFMFALKAYSKSDMDFDKCYFIHSKGITSNNDQLRKEMYKLIFDTNIIDYNFSKNEVGSYGPLLTITDVHEDIQKMYCMNKFNNVFSKEVMEYYYINTFYVIKGFLLSNFISTVDEKIWDTNILEYSDRWMFERDFSHIVDMQGYQPSFSYLHGNYSTNYQAPTMDMYNKKYNKWRTYE